MMISSLIIQSIHSYPINLKIELDKDVVFGQKKQWGE